MGELSRKAVPYTPLDRPLKELTVALVTTAGVHRRTDEPFNLEGDERFYVFPGDVATSELMVTHSHYDHADADRDINCVFPLDRLRELVAEGFIKAVSNKHIGMMGFTKKLGFVYEQTVPAIGQEIERSQADAVVLTGGCPFCHRVAVVVQREIELRGLPTVLITVAPEESRRMRPPRALCPVGFPLGRCLGPAHQPELQRRVAKMRFGSWKSFTRPAVSWTCATSGVPETLTCHADHALREKHPGPARRGGIPQIQRSFVVPQSGPAERDQDDSWRGFAASC